MGRNDFRGLCGGNVILYLDYTYICSSLYRFFFYVHIVCPVDLCYHVIIRQEEMFTGNQFSRKIFQQITVVLNGRIVHIFMLASAEMVSYIAYKYSY